MRKYAAVWRIPGAPLLLCAGVFARLGMGAGQHASSGAQGLAGLLLAVWGLGSGLGGFAYTAIAGLIVDRPGAVPWSFGLAATVIAAAVPVAAWPGGPITRADAP